MIINKNKRLPRTEKRHYDIKKDSLNAKAVYNTTIWKKLRLQFLSENPLCKRCLDKDKISSAVEVHHIIPISKGNTYDENRMLGFDIDNLEGLCKDCHTEHHNKIRELKHI
jgi:5-methylcytosine-specific restriction protein A